MKNVTCYLRFLTSAVLVLVLSAEGLPVYAGTGPGTSNDFGGRRVLVIGIDGCRRDVLQTLIQQGRAPNLKSLVDTGTTYWGLEAGGEYHTATQQPTITGPGWSSVCTGVFHNKHGIYDNDTDKRNDGNYEMYPHFFKHVRESHAYTWLGSICDAVTPNAVLELSGQGLADLIFTPSGTSKANGTADADVAQHAADAMANEDPDCLFLHFLNADHAGHTYGYGTQFPGYMDAVAGIDGYIGQVLTALRARPQYASEKWLIVVTADHGGKADKHHGSQEPGDRQVFGIFNGTGFLSGAVNNSLVYQSLIAPTCLRFLGIPIDPAWGLESGPASSGAYPTARAVVSISDVRRDIQYPGSGEVVTVSANISSVDAIVEAKLMVDTGSGTFLPVPMSNSTGQRWHAELGPYPTGTHVKYKVQASTANDVTSLPFPLAPLPFYVYLVDDTPVNDSDIVINEIAYNPPGADNSSHSEFVEAYNRRSTPVDLSFFTFSDTVVTPDDYIIPDGTVVPAHGFVVFAGNKAKFDQDYPSVLTDPKVIVLDTAGVSGFNNDGDFANLVHVNAYRWNYDVSIPFDVVPYGITAPWPENVLSGLTIELVNPVLDNSVGSNWAKSTNPYGSPGAVNTTFDNGRIGVSHVQRDLEYPGPTDEINITATVASDNPVTNVDLHVKLGTINSTIPMSRLDGETWRGSVTNLPDGSLVKYYVQASAGSDTALSPVSAPNDYHKFRVDAHPALPGDLVVNELMYDPRAYDNGSASEWFEIANTTSRPQGVGYFHYRVRRDNPDQVIPEGTVIPPHGYLIVAGVKSLFQSDYPTWNSSVGIVDGGWTGSYMTNSNSDLVEVRLVHLNALDEVPLSKLDSVQYKYSNFPWPGEFNTGSHDNGYTIELINPGLDNNDGSHWQTSATYKGTPGTENSVFDVEQSSVADWSVY